MCVHLECLELWSVRDDSRWKRAQALHSARESADGVNWEDLTEGPGFPACCTHDDSASINGVGCGSVHAAPPRVKCWHPDDRRIVSAINGASAAAVPPAGRCLPMGRSVTLIDDRIRIGVVATLVQKRAPRFGG
jgi:hypothetical protein